ncbi:MAG: hypothetical protein J1E42_03460 [Akkermansiaceae bacterium]|nr:hypothetical protein [Akkermansiaceae bacterium]
MPDTDNTPSVEPSQAPARKTTTRKPRKTAAAKAAEQSAAELPAAAPDNAPKEKKAPAARTRVRRVSTKAAAPAEASAAAEPAPATPPAPAAAAAEPIPGGYAAPETVGGHEPQGNGNHRKRRRRGRRGGDNSQPALPPRAVGIDPDELKRRAWKIYLGEVTEEGLALMDDRTAAEAARRAFRVAELFLIETAHHLPAPQEKEEPQAPAEQA